MWNDPTVSALEILFYKVLTCQFIFDKWLRKINASLDFTNKDV